MSMSLGSGLDLYYKAVEKTIEKQAWEQWLVAYSKMTKETFISFSDYLKKLKQPKVTTSKTDEEVIEDAENILKMMKRSE